MNQKSWLVAVATLLVAASALAASPQRTFVASHGDDASPTCSLNVPCRGFSAAVAAVATGGEVIVLDSAGYGAVTITKSVTIIAPQGVYAGISVSSGTGITINPGTGEVTLRNLNLVGLGGAIGIDFQSGDRLNIEGLSIRGFSDVGIKAQRNNSARILIRDTVVRSNGTYGATIGTLSGKMIVNVQRSHFEGNLSGGGLLFTDHVHANVTDSAMIGNPFGLMLNPVISGTGYDDDVVVCTRCEIDANTIAGVAAGTTATCTTRPAVNVIDSVLVGNQLGLHVQHCGAIDIANTTMAGNAILRQIDDATGQMSTYFDNRSKYYNAAYGDPFNSSDSKE